MNAPPVPSTVARVRTLALVLFAVFVVLNTGNALHKGGDFEIFVEGGSREIAGTPLYTDSSPGSGFIGPPFQALFFVPFSAVWGQSESAARLAWYALNLLALGAGIVWWSAAMTPSNRPSLRWGWSAAPVLWAVAAIALPAETNFEHQNMNPLLLSLLGWAACAWRRGRPARAGAAVGVAAALKAFPLLLLVYFVTRRQWRAALAGLGSAAALTTVAALPYGSGLWHTVMAWLAINREGGWPVRPQNQSVYAWCHRTMAWAPGLMTGAITLMLLTVLLRIAGKYGRRQRPLQAEELALALGAAILISPIAWDHYWMLMFPLLLATTRHARPIYIALLATSGILMTGISPLLAGPHLFNAARAASVYTIAGLLLVLATSVALWRENPAL